VPVHGDRAANLLRVTAALMTATWEALMGRSGVKRLAALSAVMCTLLQPALFSQPGIHGGAGAEDDHLVCIFLTPKPNPNPPCPP
jgi:hypothetical protein